MSDVYLALLVVVALAAVAMFVMMSGSNKTLDEKNSELAKKINELNTAVAVFKQQTALDNAMIAQKSEQIAVIQVDLDKYRNEVIKDLSKPCASDPFSSECITERKLISTLQLLDSSVDSVMAAYLARYQPSDTAEMRQIFHFLKTAYSTGDVDKAFNKAFNNIISSLPMMPQEYRDRVGFMLCESGDMTPNKQEEIRRIMVTGKTHSSSYYNGTTWVTNNYTEQSALSRFMTQEAAESLYKFTILVLKNRKPLLQKFCAKSVTVASLATFLNEIKPLVIKEINRLKVMGVLFTGNTVSALQKATRTTAFDNLPNKPINAISKPLYNTRANEYAKAISPVNATGM